MDICHYFEPIDFSMFSSASQLKWNLTLGANIEKTMRSYDAAKIEKIDIAIFGIPFDSRTEDGISNAPNEIRKELYQLARINKNLNIADFGNLRISKSARENYQAIRDLVEYFNEFNVVSLILGGSQDLTIGLGKAFQNNPLFSLTLVDAQLDIKSGIEPTTSKNFLSGIFKHNPNIFQFSLVGYQSYLVPSEVLLKTKGVNQHLRLGLLRDNIAEVEPIFRNTDVLSFDFNSVKYGDAPHSELKLPNGLRSEEACQLAKYAGLSNRIKVFGLFETETLNNGHRVSTKLASQIAWYFIEGFNNRPSANIKSINNKVYKVEIENIENPIVFICDPLANQWWMEITTIKNEKRYFACSETEYLIASNNEIPELWLKYVQKTDEILK
ncbi:MAG: arginase family protein [Prolixibacteraceae bacterium]|nr:arginase family protein [Prolixibacteraceae bacterium]